jgi:hypothetical protein
MRSKHSVIAASLAVLWAVGCFVFFQFFYKYHLVHRLDLQLFLYSQEYWLSYFNHPAWLASLSGDFLSQFFYFEIGGPLVVTLSILSVGGLFFLSTGRIFCTLSHDKGRKSSLCFLIRVVASLALMSWEALRNCGMEYKLASTFSLIGGIALFLLYVATPSRFRYVSGVVLLIASYWLFGYGIWALLILLLIYELSLRKVLPVILYFVVFVLTPVLLRQSYLLTWKQAFSYPATSFWNKPNLMLEKLLTLDVLSASGNWNSVALMTEKNDLKFGLWAYFYNLSHGLRGDLPYQLMNHHQPGPLGLLIQLSPTTSSLAIWSSNEAWFQLGDMTMAEHSALLGMIFSPDHRSARMVKRLAEINMVNGDMTATLKYLRMLQKTWLYKSWADQRIPGKEGAAVKTWLQKKRAFVAKSDTLRDAVNPAISLRLLLDSNRENKLALDYLLCYDLLKKNISAFMADYDKYKLPKREVPEEIYAQGLLIGLSQRNATADEVKTYQIVPNVFADFQNYTALYEKDSFGRAYLVQQFGKTYWFYFHFATFK